MHYFTAGPSEVAAWSVRKYSTAPQAAGVIHTDFQKCFIKADVMHYEDFEKYGSEEQVRANGKKLTKGKDYIVQDGDIMVFKHR